MAFGEENKVMPRICPFCNCFLDSQITNIKCYRVRVGSKQYRLTHVGTKTSCVVLMWKSTFRVLPVTFLGWMKPINQTSVSAFSRRMHQFLDVLGLPGTRGLIEQIGKHFVQEFFKLARIVWSVYSLTANRNAQLSYVREVLPRAHDWWSSEKLILREKAWNSQIPHDLAP